MEGETINPDNQEGTTKIILQLPAAPDMNHKSRGVRKGTKRGGYKKTTEHIEEATYVNDESTQKLDEFNNENIQYEEVFAEQPTAAATQNTQPVQPTPPEPEVKQPEVIKEFKPKYNTDLFNGLFLIKIFDFIFPHVLKKILVLFGVKKARHAKQLGFSKDLIAINGYFRIFAYHILFIISNICVYLRIFTYQINKI